MEADLRLGRLVKSNGKFISERGRVCDCNFDVANVARVVETKTEADRKWLVQNYEGVHTALKN